MSINRQTKRVTLLAAITLSGASLRPLVILPRKSFELELAALGYTDYAIFIESGKGYVSKDRFKIWLEHSVRPYLNEVRRDIGKPDEKAVLIIDGCSAHQEISEICASLNLVVYHLSTHSSHFYNHWIWSLLGFN